MSEKFYDLNQLDQQEVFDLAAEHLLDQNESCVNEKGNCCYFYHGLQCPAGIFLKRSHLEDASMDVREWNELVDSGIVTNKHQALVNALQKVHDNHSEDDWPNELHKVADYFNLDADIIDS